MGESIELRWGDVTAEVAPWRGALVTQLRVGATDVLYLDRATLDDPAKNVRGGIPLLFPFAGKLADGTFALTGTQMKQHGFGRDRAWTVVEVDPGSVRMRLEADAATRAQWPYAFVAEHTVTLVPRGVHCELTIVAADQPLPVSPGWHPYFAIDPAAKAAVTTGVVEGHPFSDDRELDIGAPAPVDGRSYHDIPGNGLVELVASPELRHVQLWTQPGKPFVCIEPFYGPANTVNTDRRAWVPAGEARTYWMRIRALQ